MLELRTARATHEFDHAPIRLTLFGKLGAWDAAGRDILPRNRKACALLAVLALEQGSTVSRAWLTALLWSQRDPDLARGSLRQCLHELQERLRTSAPDILIAERAYLSLRKGSVAHDVPTADDVLAVLDRGGLADGGTTLLEDLAGLDPAFSSWIEVQRRRLTERAVQAAEAALAAVPARHPELTSASAERLLRVAPAHEAASRALMAARAELGDRDGALRIFARCAAALARAREGPPSAETRALAERIRNGTPNSLPGTPPVTELLTPERDAYAIRLGVMPFRPLGSIQNNADELALCKGLAEEITTALARFRGIFLIASSSLSAFSAIPTGEGEEPSRVPGDLRLDFLLEGTVQRSRDRVRVNVRLLDLRSAALSNSVSSGEVVWSRRFDRPSIDLLTLQDEIAAETVAQVDPALILRASQVPGASDNARPPHSRQGAKASAHELVLRAIPALYRMEEVSFRGAGQRLAEAIDRDPEHAAAHAWFAYWHLFLVGQGWAADPGAAMGQARRLADLAVSLDPSDARAVSIAGHTRAFDRRSIDEALALHRRALDLNPNLPLAWVLAGLCAAYAGRHELAIRWIEQARKLSPFDPHGFFFDTALGIPLLMLGRYVESLEASRRAAAMNPTLSSSYKGYLAALGHVAADDLAQAADVARVREHLALLEPGFTLTSARSRSPLRRPEDVDLYIEGLRKAGLREH